jgi:hypothetical protein
MYTDSAPITNRESKMAEIEVEGHLLDDIREFINEKWKHSECELCGTDLWMVYPEPTSYAYIPVGGGEGPPETPQPMVAFIPASCTSCGNLRLIDARTFEKWRRERKPGRTMSSR